jgi:pimeloyl-ACP methyl ester carboxylesterase
MRRPALLLTAILVACHPESHVEPAPRPPPTPAVLPTPAPAVVEREDLGPATVERVDVPKDSPASFVRAAHGTKARVVFMPGLCSNAYAYLLAFPEAARAHGGVIAIDGDQPCGEPNSGFRTFTWSAALQRARIDAALAALGATAPADGFTLVGYSSGASIAQMIQERWPTLFPRLVIIAPPEDPTVERLAKARGVVSMSCSLDVPYRMKDATNRLNAKGVPSIYLEMPRCSHGNITDGERVFSEAFEWLDGRGA